MTLAVVASPLVQSGRHTGATVSLSDVTAIRSLERQARAQERLAALGTMAGGLLHEVRSPLASVMMHLDLLRTSVSGTEGLEVLAQAAERAPNAYPVSSSTFKSWRVYARFAATGSISAKPSGAVADTVSFPPGTDIRMSGSGSTVVYADRDLLEHAVRNVLVNAAEAVHAGTGSFALTASESITTSC